MLGDVFIKLLFVFKDGVLESHAIRANDVGVNDEVVLGVDIADGGPLVPNFLRIGRFLIKTEDDSGKNDYDDADDADNSNGFLHETPSFANAS